jgi:hypothetical protein
VPVNVRGACPNPGSSSRCTDCAIGF